MWRQIVRRLLLSIVVLWIVATATFAMMRFLPGDPVAVMLQKSGGSAERIAQLREQLGLNEPYPVQYAKFLGGLVQGDLGKSLFTGRPVTEMILEQFPATLELAAASLLVGVVVGVGLGLISALKEGSWIDNASMIFAVAGVSMPSFWAGLLLIFLFSLTLGWLPATGQGGIQRLIMPSLVLGFSVAATIARLTRSSMVEVMRKEYITTARAKGLMERLVISRHALKNALIPILTMVGLEVGWLLGGAVVTETVFSRQGIGRMAIQAVLQKDFPLVQGTVLFAALFYMAANLVVDILYMFVDPRIQTQ
ncbi:MAG TPA: ABC transporter permease [Anaerolineae bacterium]|nr:ABC transporter permease [Anaerolineae bacterium]